MYQALEPKAGRSVALKECACGRSSSAAIRIEDMKREYELIKTLQHENIVTVYDFIASEDGFVVVSMELASGGSLRQLLRKTKFRLFESTVRHYAMCALRGLEYLHKKNVLHCDIKPENIVLIGSTVKLCDFGLSKQCVGTSADGHHTQNISGTPRYMAPELWDTNTYTQASDIWALGCTLAELASGHFPWAGAVAPDAHHYAVVFFVHGLLANPAAYDPTNVVPGHLTTAFRDLLCQMLQLDASKRPTATECLQASYFLAGDSWRTDEGMESEDSYDLLLNGAHASPATTSEMLATQSNSAGTTWAATDSSKTAGLVHASPSRSLTSTVVAELGAQPQPQRVASSRRRLPLHAAEETRRTIRSSDEEVRTKPSQAPATFVWAFQNGRSQVKYDDKAQVTIEEAYHAKWKTVVVTTTRLLDGKIGSYEIDFERMTQRNTATNYRRKVLRLSEDELTQQ